MARAITLFLVVVLIGMFALVNWPAFTTPVPLSLVFTTVLAPPALIMLGLLLFMSLLFAVWAFSLQGTTLMEMRRQNKELQAQRALADSAEASRFSELRSFVTAESARVAQVTQALRTDMLARLDRLQDESRLAWEQNTNSLAAHLGEIEDRLERGTLPGPVLARDDRLSPLPR